MKTKLCFSWQPSIKTVGMDTLEMSRLLDITHTQVLHRVEHVTYRLHGVRKALAPKRMEGAKGRIARAYELDKDVACCILSSFGRTDLVLDLHKI
jgi:hypothetical protein